MGKYNQLLFLFRFCSSLLLFSTRHEFLPPIHRMVRIAAQTGQGLGVKSGCQVTTVGRTSRHTKWGKSLYRFNARGFQLGVTRSSCPNVDSSTVHRYGTWLIKEVMIWVSGSLAMSYRLLHLRRAVLDMLVDDNELAHDTGGANPDGT